MPPCALRLLSLSVPISTFMSALAQSSAKPLTINRVVRWIITPTTDSITAALLAPGAAWHLLIILPNLEPLPEELQPLIHKQWYVTAGVPSGLLKDFASKNARLLHPAPGEVPALSNNGKARTTDSAQSLELSGELAKWIENFSYEEGAGAVSMFNLLSFKPGMKASYLRYGKAFAESIGRRRGGVAKIVGKVIEVSSSTKGSAEWDEVAVAHYPSIRHFADMLAGDDYQEVNKQYRVPALRDTFILCTTELGLPLLRSEAAKL